MISRDGYRYEELLSSLPRELGRVLAFVDSVVIFHEMAPEPRLGVDPSLQPMPTVEDFAVLAAALSQEERDIPDAVGAWADKARSNAVLHSLQVASHETRPIQVGTFDLALRRGILAALARGTRASFSLLVDRWHDRCSSPEELALQAAATSPQLWKVFIPACKEAEWDWRDAAARDPFDFARSLQEGLTEAFLAPVTGMMPDHSWCFTTDWRAACGLHGTKGAPVEELAIEQTLHTIGDRLRDWRPQLLETHHARAVARAARELGLISDDDIEDMVFQRQLQTASGTLCVAEIADVARATARRT